MNCYKVFVLCFASLLIGNTSSIIGNTSLQSNNQKGKFIERRIKKIYSYDEKNQSPLVTKSIDDLFRNYSVNIDDSTKYNLLKLKLKGLVRQSQYSKILECCDTLLNNYSLYTDSSDVEDLNEIKSLNYAIKDKAPSSVKINGSCKIASKRDSLSKLISLPVTINGNKSDFILDTGANYSAISREFANKLGLEIYDVNLSIDTPISNLNGSVAFADSIIVDNLLFKNVLFLIIPMPDLSKNGLVVNGVLGNKELQMIPEIQIMKSGEIYIPKKCKSKQKQNLYYNDELGLSPYVKIKTGGKELFMLFDLGATSSEIREYNGDTTNLREYERNIAVVGSNGKRKVKIINDFPYSINGKKYITKEIYINPKHDSDGTMGQNMVMPFDCLIINNKNNYIEFK